MFPYKSYLIFLSNSFSISTKVLVYDMELVFILFFFDDISKKIVLSLCSWFTNQPFAFDCLVTGVL